MEAHLIRNVAVTHKQQGEPMNRHLIREKHIGITVAHNQAGSPAAQQPSRMTPSLGSDERRFIAYDQSALQAAARTTAVPLVGCVVSSPG